MGLLLRTHSVAQWRGWGGTGMSKTSLLQGGRAEEHELLCNGTIMSCVPEKRSGGGLGVVTYKYYNSRRRSGGGRGGRVESGTICACAYWTLPPPPDRSPGTGSDLARSFPLPALYLPIFLDKH